MNTDSHQCDSEPGWVIPSNTKSGYAYVGASQDRETADDFLFFSNRLEPVTEILGISADYVRFVVTEVTEVALEGGTLH